MARSRAEGKEGAIQIDADDPPPGFRRHVDEVRQLAPSADARVDEATIDLAEDIDRLGECALDRILVGNVAFQRHGLPAMCFELGKGRGVLLGVCPPYADRAAGLRDRVRHAEADTAVAAGD